MRVALYARVSTRQQERDQTIDSQLTALRQWATLHGHDIQPEDIFTDPGHSGARLDRPALDRLRDAVAGGDFDIVAVFSPDRLARRYAYQVLLLEEFRKVGCAIEFVQRPLSEDPHDQLLLQIQGAVAEYERGVLGERFRRGKLQRARAGHWVAGHAPYGYRYIPKCDGAPGYLVVDDSEAAGVRMMFHWLIEERLSVRQIVRRLIDSPCRPRRGARVWSPTVVHHILSDPTYAGTGYANRYFRTNSPDPRRRSRRPDAQTCRRQRPREEWIAVKVPAIIDEATHEQAVAQLARNAGLAPRRNSQHFYLLRCLLSCRRCGRAMVGITYPGDGRGPRRYYKCCGRESISRVHQPRCNCRLVWAEDLEAAVWEHVGRLVKDPDLLMAQFEAFRDETPGRPSAREEQQGQARLRRLEREETRLVDAYQAEAISLEELKERRHQLQARRRLLLAELDQQARLLSERQAAQAAYRELAEFCERVRTGLDNLLPVQRQQLLHLLVERVMVSDDAVEIRHVISLRQLRAGASPTIPDDRSRNSDAEGASPELPVSRLCSDRVRLPAVS
jgi:site-specific DNA recombinase